MIDEKTIGVIFTGAILAAGAGLMYSLKKIPKQIYDKVKQTLIYTVKIYQYDELFDVLEGWLAHNYHKQYKDVEASLKVASDYPSSDDISINAQITYKQEDNTFLIKYKGKRLIVNKNKEKMDKSTSLKDIYFRKYYISGIRAKNQIDCLLKEALSFSLKQKEKNSIKVYYNNSYGDWYSSSSIKIKPIENIILNESKKEYILEDIDRFLKSEDWYTNICVPYKRGYCFYGSPGTGKTTLGLALANHTKRNIYCLNLNSIEDDSRLPFCFSNIPERSVLLIEDIDKVFSGRDNVNEDSKITFSSVLNCLDGAFYKHGLITVITTNHIEKLDEALIRTGRIDIKMEIPKPSDKEISKYLTIFYGQNLSVHGLFDMKMSDIQGICLNNRDCPKQAVEQIIQKIIK